MQTSFQNDIQKCTMMYVNNLLLDNLSNEPVFNFPVCVVYKNRQMSKIKKEVNVKSAEDSTGNVQDNLCECTDPNTISESHKGEME